MLRVFAADPVVKEQGRMSSLDHNSPAAINANSVG